MTQLEFALKNFKEGAKIILTENKISTFSVGEVSLYFTVHDWFFFTSIFLNETNKKI